MTKEMLSDYRIVENINEYLVTLGTGQSLADSLDQFIAVGLLLLLAFSANFICRTVLLHVVTKLVKNTKVTWDDVLFDKKVLVNLSRMVAPVLIYVLLPVVFPREPDVVSFLQRLCMIYIIATFLRFINVFLTAIYHVYSEKEQFKDRPLKGLLQTAQVTLFFIGGIAIVSILMNKSPAVLLTGLGASAAILMLVFKDSIMGFVSGIQLSANNMLRVGDWIVMSKYGADGTVIEVTLNTVKVRNWDNTITTIPPYALVSDSFQNWRGMQDAGVRRIKRSLLIDQSSVHFMTSQEQDKLKNFLLLDHYLNSKNEELEQSNQQLVNQSQYNHRRLTNLGTFRAYIEFYLKQHPSINNTEALIIRQLQPTSEGLPLEIYAFTQTALWKEYENIQSDIFDHLIAIIPEFGLKLYQAPSGTDFRQLAITTSERLEYN